MPSLLLQTGPSNAAKRRRDLMLVVQVAGLIGTAWLVWSMSLLPRLNRESAVDMVTQALGYAFLACTASVAITISLYLLAAHSLRDDAIQMALRTSTTAVWFAAATILLAQMSPATIAAALILVVSTTRLLYSQWRLVHPFEPCLFTGPVQHPFFDPPPSPRFRDLVPGLTASFAIEAGVLLFPIGYPLLAAALFCLSVAMITFCALRAGVFPEQAPGDLPRSILGLLLTLILAAGLTAGGLVATPGSTSYWHSPLQQRPGPLQSARALLHKFFEDAGEGRSREPATNLYFPPASNVEITDNSFPGVILLPETEPKEPVLNAPSISWTRTSPEISPVKPVSIPFSGVYWMYRPPFDRPPRTSHVQQGNPLMLSFRTTDHAPMSMEAYQKLGREIDIKCCRGIQIAVSSMDRFPGTIALELVLIDTSSTTQPLLSLGTIGVTSPPRTDSGANGKLPASEILDFALPASGALHQFDLIKVIFHRDALRVETSARISIDRFLFLPR